MRPTICRHLGLLLWLSATACSGDKGESGSTDDGTGDDGSGDDGSGDGGEDGGDDGGTGDDCSTSAYADADICTSWRLNTTEVAAVIATDGSEGLVDVQSATVSSDGGADFVTLTSGGVPSYAVTFDDDRIAELRARPHAATDFVSGAPTVSAGDTVQFGEDIGFDSTGCTRDGVDEGAGYWPPGPDCPEFMEKSMTIPVEATEASEDCYTPVGFAGMFVNGVSLFNWTDGFSYNNDAVWYNLAPKFEVYDAGVCNGHAAGGEYHHHSAAVCLGDQLGDDGTTHSPIYAWAPDGVPVHGPYVAAGSVAESCWKTRDYTTDSPTGCGEDGKRSCLLVDPLDPGAGTTPATSNGPSTSATVTSLSGNTFVAESGYYFEDYYFDSDCAGGGLPAMDEHNGHDHDGLGYHYHMTATYPYFVGPTYYGTLAANAAVDCQDTPYSELGGGGGGDGGPPPTE